MRAPDYDGGGLVNLVAEIENRLSGESASPRLHSGLGAAIPDTSSFVLVLFDALGDLQLTTQPAAATLARHRAGALDASFSTQTSVATATLATGLPPSQHGLISYLLRLEGHASPISTLWWFAIDGSPAPIDLESVLPSPNLAERLSVHGIETVVVEPQSYLDGPLDRVLYRGARTRGVARETDLASATLEEVAHPGRLVVCYLPYVDAAGHVYGTDSVAYTEALHQVTDVWEAIGSRLPAHAGMLGTADHGMVDVATSGHVRLEAPPNVVLTGDNRVVYVYGVDETIAPWAATLPGTWHPVRDLPAMWGPEPAHPRFRSRLPIGLLEADPGMVYQYPGNNTPLVGYHGGCTEAELRIPLLVW